MKLFSILLFLSIALKGYAQSDFTFYYNKEGAEVKQKSEANFIRTVLKQTDGTFLIKEFNGKDTLLLEGAASTYPPISFQGVVKRYYENGKLKEKVNYEKNRPKGLAQFYYANGQLKKTLEYYTETSADSSLITPLLKFQMVSFYDSLGVQLVKNGNGFAVEKSQDWLNKGKYVNGFKDSIWIGEGVDDIRSYRETYVKGELKSGVSVKEGKQYNYTKEEIMPEFPGGMNTFYQFVGKTYKYSAAAIKNEVSGTIILSFVVEKDGTITDIKVLKDLGLGTGAQAIKLMKKSPNWNPGSHHGIPVKVQYTLPIHLQLAD